jgi:hypothetical protein
MADSGAGASTGPVGRGKKEHFKTPQQIQEEYNKKQQQTCAFFKTLITSRPPSMQILQYVLLLAQIVLMRFSPDVLQIVIDGKNIKAHIGSAFVHFLGKEIYNIQNLALECFLKELRSLAPAEQCNVVFTVLTYFSTRSLLSDESGNECPNDTVWKYHTLFLFGMHGGFFTAVCDFAVAAKILTIEQVCTFFKVSGQNGFMRGDKATSSSLMTHEAKVRERIINQQKVIDNTAEELKKLMEQLVVIEQKLSDTTFSSKHTGLAKNKDALILQKERATNALSTHQTKMKELHRLLESILKVESIVSNHETIEVFYPGENTEDSFSKFTASLNPCISHIDSALKLEIGLNWTSLKLIRAVQTKHHNTILKLANKEAIRRMAEASFQGDSSKSPNDAEGVVVGVNVKFADGRLITCNMKVKNEGAP